MIGCVLLNISQRNFALVATVKQLNVSLNLRNVSILEVTLLCFFDVKLVLVILICVQQLKAAHFLFR